MTQHSPEPSEISSDKDSETSPTSARTKQSPLAKYQWQPGKSGNPAGKQVGTKNKITQQKLGVESILRDQLNEYMPEILQKAIELALSGDKKMIAQLLDLTISKAVAVEDVSEGKDRVQVTIRKLDTLAINSPKDTLPESNIIDVTPLEVTEVIDE